jgi:hypothetical protein
MLVTQPGVALTDYVLAVETLVLGVLLWRRRWGGPLRPWSAALFACLCVASLAGGTTHGFFLADGSTGHDVLWSLTLLSIGGTALCLWVVAAKMRYQARIARRLMSAGLAAIALYVLVVLAVSGAFLIAIAAYLPATLFFMAVLWPIARRTGERSAWSGVVAAALTLVASAIQRIQIDIPGVPDAHNVLYHCVEAVAFWLLFRSLWWISSLRLLPVLRDRDR